MIDVACRHRGSAASLCLLIDFQIGDLHHERQSGSALRVARCHEPASIVNAVLLRGMTCAPPACQCAAWRTTARLALPPFAESLFYEPILFMK